MGIITHQSRNTITLKTDDLHEGTRFELHIEPFGAETGGTKHQREYLQKSVRGLLLAYIGMLEQQFGNISPMTVMNFSNRLRILVGWMTTRGIWRFSQLREEDIVDFIKTRRISASTGRPLKSSTVSAYITQLSKMWLLRRQYVAPLGVDVLLLSELGDILRGSPPTQRWSPIPEIYAIPLIQHAIEWIRAIGPSLMPVVKRLTQRSWAMVGKTRAQRKHAISHQYRELEKTPEFIALRNHLELPDAPASRLVRQTIRLSIGASVAIILFLTGMRGSELLSLKRGCRVSRRHSNGHEYRYVNGVAAKQQSRQRLWIVPEPVEEAIQLLEVLNTSIAVDAQERLFISFKGNGAIPAPWTKIRAIGHTMFIAQIFREFVATCVPEIPIAESRRLHLHQARKTFARFVALRDKRSLEALAQHFGHVYIGITDSAYVGTDIGLHEMLNEESRADLAAGLTDLISSRSVGGRAGQSIESFRSSLADKTRFRGKRAINKIVEDLINRGAILAPCDWGYCLYAKDMSACNGDVRGPNPVNRNPGTCSSCANFAITERHRAWWEERYRREENFLARCDLPEQTRLVCEARLNESRQVLRSLNERKYSVSLSRQEEREE